MTQEEKQLLLKDLCAREYYHPAIQVFNDGWEGFQEEEFDTNLRTYHIDAFRCDRIEVHPYLRPMSSMTAEEKEDFGVPFTSEGLVTLADTVECMDWLIAHHFDYRGLIEKGLALEAPEGMYKIK